jgi:hypothetical protein
MGDTPSIRLRTSINSLEFLACIITVWIDTTLQLIQPEDCILSQADNTTAADWFCKSNFTEERDDSAQLAIAHHLASLIICTKSCIYSQWLSGGLNSISDSLSRDFHINDSPLSDLLCSSFPDQAPLV